MIKLDRIGEKILQALETDGRISITELAQRVGLSPSACLRRVQELERSGVIRGYRAQVDRSKLGMAFWPMSPWACRSTQSPHRKPSR